MLYSAPRPPESHLDPLERPTRVPFFGAGEEARRICLQSALLYPALSLSR